MDGCVNYSAAGGSNEAGRVHSSRFQNVRRVVSSDVNVTSIGGLPAIQNASGQRENPSQNPLSLNASESKARANRIMIQERWRSVLLEYEVGLKELVTNSMEEPPSAIRTMKTFQLYDSVTRAVAQQSPEFGNMLRMFRMEFCRAIFTQPTLTASYLHPEDEGSGQSEELGATYFDQTEMLLRENAALRLEVNLGNTRDNLARLRQELENFREAVTYYENEVSRLERENERYAASYVTARDELTSEREKNRKIKNEFDDVRLRLLQENKDLHLRICRLRKCLSDNESVFVKDAYKVIKDKRMTLLQGLFEQGDERVVLLVMLSQLEGRMNELLDQYDRDVLFGDYAGEYEQCRRTLGVVALLIEEMHLCEQRYMQLLPRDGKLINDEQDETDVFASLLSDPRMYEALVARLCIRQGGSSKTTPQLLKLVDDALPDGPEVRMSLAVYKGAQTTSPAESNTQNSVSAVREMDDTVAQVPAPSRKVSILYSHDGNPDTSSNTIPNDSFCHLRTASSPDDSEEAAKRKSEGEAGEPQKPPIIQKLGGKKFPLEMPQSFVDLPEEMFEEAKRKQEEWVANILLTSDEGDQLLQRVKAGGASSSHLTKGEQLMRHFLMKPMLDVSANKFHCGIDVFTGPAQHTQALLCSVNHVDPVEPFAVPQGTRFMHIKYRNVLREEAVVKGDDSSNNLSVSEALEEWGGKTIFTRVDCAHEQNKNEVAEMLSKSHLFGELKPSNYSKSLLKGVMASSSTSPATAVFLRLNPLSPNRSPEWLLYQNMFGGYRPITPRLIDVSTIGHILLNSCERHFQRAEERYLRCLEQTKTRATNSEMVRMLVESVFRESYVLTEFQESFVKELESRYCYPELVAKTMYEILCYFDATMAAQPLVDLYLSCIRGFESPTRIHYITYVMHQISANWPSSNPEEAIEKEDVLTLLEHVYKRASGVISMGPSEIISEYQLATHSAPITLNALRGYLVTIMLHYEDPLSLYFNGLLSYRAKSNSVVTMNYEQFEAALEGTWEEAVEGKLFIRYLVSGCGFNKTEELSTKELACVATSMWSSHMWKSM